MHRGPKDPEMIRMMYGLDQLHSEPRKIAGAMFLAGIFAAGILAISAPMAAAIAIAIAAGGLWSARRLARKRRAESIDERRPAQVAGSLAAILERGNR
ncbi:hypothetical protein OB919_11000 [Halobacteria archaeon AArc-curdl1]|uniref:Uncharacterized protein n=1 Tax=Natronosalvus hydrolyticus TaxID=2979988 RepID=A0AAP2Z963_9EURY|nr:hypothetical protein [Halobacteria archaeon AArc-curdl1]